MKVAVIGAGLAGVTTCEALWSRGCKVVLFEAEREAARVCSHQNGGQLSVCNAEVWNSPQSLGRAMLWLFQKNKPLKIDWSWDLDKYSWLAKFAAHSPFHKHNTQTTKVLGEFSRRAFKDLIERYKIDCDYRQCGILKISRRRRTKKFYPHDGVADAYKLCQGLLAKLPQVDFRTNTRIHRIDGSVLEAEHLLTGRTYMENFDAVVLCAGIRSASLARLPIYPVKGYSISIPIDDSCPFNESILDEDEKIVASRLGNTLRVAGRAEIVGYNLTVYYDPIDTLVKWTRENIPNANAGMYHPWACLRPMTPSMLPIVRQSKLNRKLFYNTGHGHLGLTLAPATALLIAEKIKC